MFSFPDPVHPVLAEVLPAAPQSVIGFAIATTNPFVGKVGERLGEWYIAIRSRLVAYGGPVQTQIVTGGSLGETALLQISQQGVTLGFVGYFFCRYSCKASRARSRSARSRLSRAFSFSNSLRRCASETLIPP